MNRTAFFLLLASLAGCSAPSSTEGECAGAKCVKIPPICDGSDELRVRYRVIGGGPTAPGEATFVENGFRWFAIDGKCRYWVYPGDSGPHGVFSDTRKGVLRDSEAAKLADDIDFFPSTGFTSSEEGLADASTRQLSTIWGESSCYGRCGAEDQEAVLKAAEDWLSRLYEEGEPVNNGLRATVWAFAKDAPAREHPTKPFPAELLPYVKAANEEPRPFETFVVPSSLEASFREYRDEYRSLPRDEFWYRYIPLEDEDGRRYELRFRDRVPLEDESGRIIFRDEE